MLFDVHRSSPGSCFAQVWALEAQGFHPTPPTLCHARHAPPVSAPANGAGAQPLTELFLFVGGPIADADRCQALITNHASRVRVFAAVCGKLAEGHVARAFARCVWGGGGARASVCVCVRPCTRARAFVCVNYFLYFTLTA